MSVLDLARAEIRALQPYSSARMEASGGELLLNANESAWAPTGDTGTGCNRYPEPQPAALVDALARLYGVRRDLQEQLAQQGYNVRVYVPYGNAWYPYLMRRLAERPANLAFFLRSLAQEALRGGHRESAQRIPQPGSPS